MARKINNIEDHNKWVTQTNVQTIITFRNQQLLDLWINEMSGQISDGMWENARRTEWLWQNVLLRLGDVTKVEVAYMGHVGRKSFGMTGELWDIIGDRIIDENGFENEKEAKKAWREIAVAIYNATVTAEIDKIRKEAQKQKEDQVKRQWPELRQEWLDAGIEEEVYSWGGTVYRTYINTEKKRGYVSVDRTTTRENELKTVLRYDERNYTVAKGKLKDALEALRTFAYAMEAVRS